MKFKVTLSIGFPGARHEDTLEIEESELEGMSEEEREKYINEAAWEWAYNYIDVWWEKEEEN